MVNHPDHDINAVAAQQHGAFTRSQACDLGMSKGQIRNRLRQGRWVRLLAGVYCLPGAQIGPRCLVKAATLAVPNSVASHESAAELHGFSYTRRGLVSVTAPPGSNHRLAIGCVHEYAGIIDADHTVVDGIPVTTRSLTLFHLSAVLRKHQLERVLDDRLNARSVTLDELFALSDFWTRRGFPGSDAMRQLLVRRGPGFRPPESELEAAFLRLVRRHGLPEPTRQLAAPWNPSECRVDFAYEDLRILIEVDGRRWHGRDADFDKDRARDRKAQLAGWVVLRFTWHEITQRPAQVAAELETFLDRRKVEPPAKRGV